LGNKGLKVSNINGNKESDNVENVATISINSHLIKVTYPRIFLFLFLLTFISMFSVLVISALYINLIGFIILANAVLWISIGFIMIILGKVELK
jgi:hypothetical protein